MRRLLLFLFFFTVFNTSSVFAYQEGNCGVPDADGKCKAGCYYDSLSLVGGPVCSPCWPGTYKSEGMDSCEPCSAPKNVEGVEVSFIDGDEYYGFTTDSCPWKLACPGGMFWSYAGGKGECKICGDYSVIDSNCYDTEVCQDPDLCIIRGNNDLNGNINLGSLSAITNENSVCVPRIYDVVLDKNTNLTELNGKIYENKKMTVSCGDDSINAEAYLQPTQPVKIFSGYATESNTCNKEIFNEDGKLVVSPDFFDSDKTLYACWDNPNITIYYYFEDPGETMKKQTCRVDDTKTEVDCNFEDYSGAGSAGKYFSGFSCMYKQENGALAACSNDPDEIYEIGEPIPLLGTEIYVKILFSDCVAGYYCEDSNLLVECPIGTTSDAASSSIEDCYMPSGQSGTKFCDKNGCFYLPTGIGNISYNPS